MSSSWDASVCQVDITGIMKRNKIKKRSKNESTNFMVELYGTQKKQHFY